MSDDPFPQQLPTLQRLGVGEPTMTSATEVATAWFNAFSNAVSSSDISGILNLFLDDGFWKDTLALTWNFRTIEGKHAIKNLLDHRLAPTGLVDLRLCHEPFFAPELLKLFPDLVLLRLAFEFGTKVGKGTAVCYLAPLPGPTWKAYSLYTCLQSLNDFPEQVLLNFSRHVIKLTSNTDRSSPQIRSRTWHLGRETPPRRGTCRWRPSRDCGWRGPHRS